jgi:hypothetical protein
VNRPVQDVAPELIGAQQVVRARRLEAAAGRRHGGLERPDEQVGSDREDGEHGEQDDPDHTLAPSQEPSGEVAGAARAEAPPLGAQVRRRNRRAHVRTRGSRKP